MGDDLRLPDGARRDPRNVDFAWTDRPGAGRRLTADQRARFDEQGFVVLEDLIDPATLAEVTAEIDPVEAEVERAIVEAGGTVLIARADEITFTTHLVARSERLRRFVSEPPLTDLCADLIGPDVRMYWDQAVYKKPETDAPFPWHQDNGYAYVEPQQYLTVWLALTDADEGNGCPWVVPGLHRAGTLEHRWTDVGLVCFEDPDGAVPAPVPAGGAVVFSSLTPHCTGPNRTAETRKAYIVQYAPDGAEVVHPDRREPATAPDRQFPVLVAGERPGTSPSPR